MMQPGTARASGPQQSWGKAWCARLEIIPVLFVFIPVLFVFIPVLFVFNDNIAKIVMLYRYFFIGFAEYHC